MIEGFYRIVSGLSALAGALAALILVYILFHIGYEIVLRTVFDSSTFVLDEFVGYAIAAMTFLSLGHALERGALIRVDLVIAGVRGRVRRWIELFCIAASAGMVGFCLAYVYRDAHRDWSRGSTSSSIAEVPLWIPKGLIVVGLALLLLQLIAYFLRVAAGGPVVVSDAQVDAQEQSDPDALPGRGGDG